MKAQGASSPSWRSTVERGLAERRDDLFDALLRWPRYIGVNRSSGQLQCGESTLQQGSRHISMLALLEPGADQL